MATQGFKHPLNGERRSQIMAGLRKAGVVVSALAVDAVYRGENTYSANGVTQIVPAHKYRAVQRELFDKLGKR